MSIKETFRKFAADCRAKHAEKVSYRRAYKVFNTAITVGDIDAIRTLLRDDVIDINTPPRGTPPAIAVAVQEKRNGILALLLENGADPNTSLHETGFGYIQDTPVLNLAIKSDNEEGARILLQQADIDPGQIGHTTTLGSIHGGGASYGERAIDLARQSGMDTIASLIAAHPNSKPEEPPRQKKRGGHPHAPIPQH